MQNRLFNTSSISPVPPPASKSVLSPALELALPTAIQQITQQLTDFITSISATDYARSLDALSGNTIGKHVRHIIEFYEALLQSCEVGVLNYDLRKRNLVYETNPQIAATQLLYAVEQLTQQLSNKNIAISLHYSVMCGIEGQVASCLEREMLYNLEHTIHHQAIIQIAAKTAGFAQHLPPSFGVAFSTQQANK